MNPFRLSFRDNRGATATATDADAIGRDPEWRAHVAAVNARVLASLESAPVTPQQQRDLAAIRKVRDSAAPCNGCAQVRATVKSWADAIAQALKPANGPMAEQIRKFNEQNKG